VTEINLLELKPVRSCRWAKEEECVSLVVPRFRFSLLRKWLLPRLKKPYYRIKLDAVGTLVWEACDGRNTVREIGEKLRSRFGEKVAPVYDRLELFLSQLERNSFIEYPELKVVSKKG
jgi:hypothetical protein